MFFHFIAFLTVAVWGTTFVWTKLLISAGLTPAQIFLVRFLIAYLMLTLFSLLRPFFLKKKLREAYPEKWQKIQHRWLSRSWRDELNMAGIGIFGGSLYFMTENAALMFTTATNVSLIVCSCPLFTALVFKVFYPSEPFTKMQLGGSLLAFIGMAVVVLNGQFVLLLSPKGDTLAFLSCLSWVGYSLLMQPVMNRYSALFITRKVFFYGIITILPAFLFFEGLPPLSLLLRPDLLLNILFLGCVASMICYLTWSWCMVKLGAVICTNWVYLNPLVTIVFAWLVLSEEITLFFLLGASFILLGLFLSSRKPLKTQKVKEKR